MLLKSQFCKMLTLSYPVEFTTLFIPAFVITSEKLINLEVVVMASGFRSIKAKHIDYLFTFLTVSTVYIYQQFPAIIITLNLANKIFHSLTLTFALKFEIWDLMNAQSCHLCMCVT